MPILPVAAELRCPSDTCDPRPRSCPDSSRLPSRTAGHKEKGPRIASRPLRSASDQRSEDARILFVADEAQLADAAALDHRHDIVDDEIARIGVGLNLQFGLDRQRLRSEEHTSELQSLMRISYAVFCLQKKN